MRYWIETLGCAKNHVDSEKLAGWLAGLGYDAADDPGSAELVVANTCAFIEAAREESIETVLDLADRRAPGARLVVTGCMAERYGEELAEALPEVDLVAGFGESLMATPRAPVARRAGLRPAQPGRARRRRRRGPTSRSPRAATGAAASARSRRSAATRRSRSADAVLAEVAGLAGAACARSSSIAQDLASLGPRPAPRPAPRRSKCSTTARPSRSSTSSPGVGRRGRPGAPPLPVPVRAHGGADRRRSSATGVPYFDLSLAARSAARSCARCGAGATPTGSSSASRRSARPSRDATFRSSFILGYPGETEDDQRRLLEFLGEAQLDWAGFFTFSPEEGTPGGRARRPGRPATSRSSACARSASCRTRSRADARDALVGARRDGPGRRARGRAHRPRVPGDRRHRPRGPVAGRRGPWSSVEIVASYGTDLEAVRA